MGEPAAETMTPRQVCPEHPHQPVTWRGTGCRRCRAEREASEHERSTLRARRRHRRTTDRENPTQ